MAVIGDSDQLGNWISPHVFLQYLDGHMWRTKDFVKLSTSQFLFKYAVMEQNQIINLEEGENRSVDLEAALAQSEDQNSQPEYFKLKN